MPELSPAVDHHGLWPFQAGGATMVRSHIHPEVELNLLLSSAARYETPQGTLPLPPGRLVGFWGGYPHRLVGAEPIHLVGVTLPLAAVTGHPALGGAVDALLRGEMLTGTAEEGPGDELLLRRWASELGAGRVTEEVCVLEIQARVARLGAYPGAAGASDDRYRHAAERLLTVVARRYIEPVSAAASGYRHGRGSTGRSARR